MNPHDAARRNGWPERPQFRSNPARTAPPCAHGRDGGAIERSCQVHESASHRARRPGTPGPACTNLPRLTRMASRAGSAWPREAAFGARPAVGWVTVRGSVWKRPLCAHGPRRCGCGTGTVWAGGAARSMAALRAVRPANPRPYSFTSARWHPAPAPCPRGGPPPHPHPRPRPRPRPCPCPCPRSEKMDRMDGRWPSARRRGSSPKDTLHRTKTVQPAKKNLRAACWRAGGR